MTICDYRYQSRVRFAEVAEAYPVLAVVVENVVVYNDVFAVAVVVVVAVPRQ